MSKTKISVPGSVLSPHSAQEPDQIAEDIKSAKNLETKLVNKARLGINKMKTARMVSSIKTRKNKNRKGRNKKIRLAVIVLGLPIIFIIVFVSNFVSRQRETLKAPDVQTIAPSPISTSVELPSVYAEDQKILEIENKTRVINGELSNLRLGSNFLSVPNVLGDLGL